MRKMLRTHSWPIVGKTDCGFGADQTGKKGGHLTPMLDHKLWTSWLRLFRKRYDISDVERGT